MEIRTKFNVGDKVWVIKHKYEKQTCYICEGKKIVKIKDTEFQCPNCCGIGYTNDKEVWFVDHIITIDEIRIYNVGKYSEINNICNDERWAINEEDCFATKAEAQKECERRNGK